MTTFEDLNVKKWHRYSPKWNWFRFTPKDKLKVFYWSLFLYFLAICTKLKTNSEKDKRRRHVLCTCPSRRWKPELHSTIKGDDCRYSKMKEVAFFLFRSFHSVTENWWDGGKQRSLLVCLLNPPIIHRWRLPVTSAGFIFICTRRIRIRILRFINDGPVGACWCCR